MRFDIPGPHPRKVVLYRDFRERVYDLPCTVTDPSDIEALSSVPGIEVVVEEVLTPGVPDGPAELSVDPDSEIPGTIEEFIEPQRKPKTSRKEV